MKLFRDGIGGTTGDTLVTQSPLQLTGDVWYVHYTDGTDAASPAGKQRVAPLKTIGQAYTNAAAGDVIVLMAGSDETRTTALAIAKNLIIIGEGTFGTASQARLRINSAAAGLLTISANSVQIRGIYFPPNVVASAQTKVAVGGPQAAIKDCYFEAGANDTGFQVAVDSDASRFRGVYFVSTSTTTAPAGAITTSSALTDILLEDVVVNGGTKGWSNQYAINMTASAPNRFIAENLSLLNGSDVGLHASSAACLVTLGTCSGSARVVQA